MGVTGTLGPPQPPPPPQTTPLLSDMGKLAWLVNRSRKSNTSKIRHTNQQNVLSSAHTCFQVIFPQRISQKVSSVFLSSPGSCGNTSRYLAPQTGWSFGYVGCLETRTCLSPLPSHLIIACVSWRYCPWAKVKSAADRHELLRKEGIKELVRDYLRKTKHFESMIHSVCVNLIVLGTSIST